MGFPVEYIDQFLPKLLLHLLSILAFIRQFTYAMLSILGFAKFLDTGARDSASEPRSVSAELIRELLPMVVKFSEFSEEKELAERCAVCLCEYEGEDEIRRLGNCRHIFHRSCVDRWMEQDETTCPLCRAHFVPEGMQAAFNEKLWLASGISDFYGEYLPITAAL